MRALQMRLMFLRGHEAAARLGERERAPRRLQAAYRDADLIARWREERSPALAAAGRALHRRHRRHQEVLAAIEAAEMSGRTRGYARRGEISR